MAELKPVLQERPQTGFKLSAGDAGSSGRTRIARRQRGVAGQKVAAEDDFPDQSCDLSACNFPFFPIPDMNKWSETKEKPQEPNVVFAKRT